jgi:hypothetical protein
MIKNRKMMRISLLLIGLLLVTVSSAFVVQKALAGSCFADVADATFWYSVTCWMKYKGISTGYADGTYRPDATVSRGEMGLFIQRAFTNPSMVTYLSVGPTGWTANGTGNGYVNTYYYWSWLRKATAGSTEFQLTPTIPTSLYNTLMYAKGVKVCYDASTAGGYLDFIEIRDVYYSSSGPTLWSTATDNTDRNGIGCTLLNFASPAVMTETDQIVVILGVQYGSTGYELAVGTTTVMLQPSTGQVILGIDDLEAVKLERGGIIPTEYDPATGIRP